ncbi:MAG: tetratricopeptide repeat protein, partial [Gemmatimonadetes bacterium]|nr:tetratricopeptide repeat protein [Gemmatimonadota bacterium]
RRALGLAIAAYQEVLRRDPQYARGHYNLGNAYLLAGEEERAVASFAKAIEADPEHRKAQQMLAKLRQREAQGER